MLPRRSPLELLSLVALSLIPAALPPLAACEYDVSPDDLAAALSTLWAGRPDERREAAEGARTWSTCLDESDSPDAPEMVRQAVEALRTILHTEKDDWTRARLLQNLLKAPAAALAPLYLDGLGDVSPNVRWRAIEYFRQRPHPAAQALLEELWGSEERPWVLRDLIEALDRNGSDRFRDDWVRLARSGDADLALAAIEVLGRKPDERMVPALAALSRAPHAEIAGAAIVALASWRDSPAAREAVQQALARASSEILLLALPGIASFLQEDSTMQLEEMARAHLDPDVRCAALLALQDADPDGLEAILVGTLEQSPSEQTRNLQMASLFVLHQRDDAEAAAALSRLDPELGGRFFNVGRLLGILSRNRDASDSRGSWPEPDCGHPPAGDADGPADQEERQVISGGAGLRTVRCWRYPQIAGDPEVYRRIPLGAKARITDHFEVGSEPWVEILGEEYPACWIPAEQIQPAVPPVSPPEVADRFSVEIDLSIEEAGRRPARDLAALGVLESIDPASDVMGFALHVDPQDSDALPLLISAYQDDGSLLDEALASLLRGLHAALPKRPELEAFFGKHPELEQEATDEP